jgi:hypothetical protein
VLVVVLGVQEPLDGGPESCHSVKHAAAHRLALEQGKLDLNLVHPASTGGSEVQVKARVVRNHAWTEGCGWVA